MYLRKDTPNGEVNAHTDNAKLIKSLKTDGFYEIPTRERLVMVLADALWSYLMPLVIASLIFATITDATAADAVASMWFIACCSVALLLSKIRL